jgi:NADPH2:quinone reductase
MQHVQLQSPGGVDRLALVTADPPRPGPGEIALRQTAAGINFVDIYHRVGTYPLPAYPAVLGIEGAGVIEALGPGVAGLAIGDRVGYAGALGGYATARVLPAWRAVKLPDALDDAVAATLLARGITVHMLETRIYPVAAGTRVLVHSAAGGLGSVLVRWAKRRGAVVIGTVGSPAKAALARAAGADHVLIGRDLDFGAEVAALTGGRGVDVAYDGVGGATLARTLACVRPFGTVASFGEAAGPIPPLRVEDLGPRRSLVLARPSVMHYMQEPETYRAAAAEVLAAALGGVTPALGRAYRLADAAAAHAELEAGATTGASYFAL